MVKRKLKKNIIKKAISFLFYINSIIFICAGIVGLVSLKQQDFTKIKGLNSNLNKTVSTKEMISSHQKLEARKPRREQKPIMYNNFVDAITNAKYHATSFVGKLVHYGPDCPACGGRLGCNGQDARNGNIYYNDKEFGKVRIVATSSSIPCGSIMRIHVNAYDPNGMYVIVLDRGVSGPMIDLLKTSAKAKSPVATVNGVTFDIVRYGY